MLPIRDKNPSHSIPFIVYLLVTANIFAFVYQLSLPERALDLFVQRYGFIPARYLGPSGFLLDPVPWITSMFLHGGFSHLFGNLLYLFIFGDNVEDTLGHRRFLWFYLTCGLCAAAAQYLNSPGSLVPMVGASGAISGVLGAYLVLFPRAKVVTFWWIIFIVRFIEFPAIIYLGLWFLYQLVSGLADTQTGGGGVAFWAHIGGFVAGVVLIKLFTPGSRR